MEERKYKLIFEMKDVGTYDSPKEAFKEIYDRLKVLKSVPAIQAQWWKRVLVPVKLGD